MAVRDKRTPSPAKDEPQQQQPQPPSSAQPPGPKPVWSRRYWTGGGAVEVAVFERAVDGGNNSFVTYSAGARRSYKEGDEYRTTHTFRPEDLLPLAHALTQAFAWIGEQDRK